jgi:hypothetical protein
MFKFVFDAKWEHADINDFFQIVYLEIYTSIHRYEFGKGNLRSYLYGTIRNMFYAEQKQRHKNKKVMNSIQDYQEKYMTSSSSGSLSDEWETKIIDISSLDELKIDESKKKKFLEQLRSETDSDEFNLLHYLIEGGKMRTFIASNTNKSRATWFRIKDRATHKARLAYMELIK